MALPHIGSQEREKAPHHLTYCLASISLAPPEGTGLAVEEDEELADCAVLTRSLHKVIGELHRVLGNCLCNAYTITTRGTGGATQGTRGATKGTRGATQGTRESPVQ